MWVAQYFGLPAPWRSLASPPMAAIWPHKGPMTTNSHQHWTTHLRWSDQHCTQQPTTANRRAYFELYYDV